MVKDRWVGKVYRGGITKVKGGRTWCFQYTHTPIPSFVTWEKEEEEGEGWGLGDILKEATAELAVGWLLDCNV